MLKDPGELNIVKHSILYRGFVFLLCSMLKDPGELNIVKHSILYRGFPVHLINIIVSKSISNRCQELPKLVFMNKSDIVLVKTSKGILDNLFRVCSLQSLTKHCEEHGEVDGTRSFVHHAVQVLLGRVLSKGCEHVVKVFIVDKTVSVVVNHVKCLLELLNLILVEHSKNIASSSLSSFLSSASSSCCFS